MSSLNYLAFHPFVRDAVYDRAIGCIVGSALGDCIGLYTEFLPRPEVERSYPDRNFSLVEPITPFRADSHRDKFEPREWTDDTDHALLLVLSYIHLNGEIKPHDFAARLRSWISQGLRCLDKLPLGLGQTVGRAALDSSFTSNPEQVALQLWLKLGRNSAANGSLMRTHPLGVMCLGMSLEETFQTAADLSLVTHPDPRCVVSCCLATALIRGILRGEVTTERDLDALIDTTYDWITTKPSLVDPRPGTPLAEAPPSKTPTEPASDLSPYILSKAEYLQHTHAKSYTDFKLDDSRTMGYVYKCLGSSILALRLALRSLHCSPSSPPHLTDMPVHPPPKPSSIAQTPTIFQTLITDLILQGGDADTNACVAGSFLGALVGYTRLPPQWESGMAHREWLVRKAEVLCRIVGVVDDSVVVVDSETDLGDTGLDGGRGGELSQKELEEREFRLVEKILLKGQERRVREEGERRAREGGGGVGRWFSKALGGSS